MVLNFQIEISDEIIECFGYSLYKRNQKKSLEAKELFEKLFLDLQSELQKESQINIQHLSNLDNRLRLVEHSAADSEDVERAINKLNNRITRIEFNVDNYKRQQDAIAANINQIETTVNQLYTTLNGKIEKLEKKFKIELNNEVERIVDAAVKKILATDLSGVIQAAVDNAVKTTTPAPVINEKIQAEVAKAVGNIQPPNEFNVDNYKRQQDAIAANMNQIETTVNQLYTTLNGKIEKLEKKFKIELNNEVERIVDAAVKKILATDLSGVIQAAVDNAVKTTTPAPVINEKIQAEVAKAIKEERQKTQAGNAIYPSSYLIFEQQRNNINELKELINTQQKVIEDLKARLSAVEGKAATATVELATEEYTPLKIRDESSWLKYKSRLKDIGKLKLFADKNPVEFKIFASKLKRIENAIDKINPNEFNEYTTETITDKIVEVVKEFIDVLETCRRKIKNPAKNSVAAQELYTLIEEYLSGLGIRSMNFKVGDNFEKWADLSMSEAPIIENTFDNRKHNILKEILVQPHYIEFINEHDKKVRRVFGGRCVAYAYKKGDEYGRVFSRN